MVSPKHKAVKYAGLMLTQQRFVIAVDSLIDLAIRSPYPVLSS